MERGKSKLSNNSIFILYLGNIRGPKVNSNWKQGCLPCGTAFIPSPIFVT